MTVVDLVSIIGAIAETENAVVAGEGRHDASDGKVGLGHHIHRRIVRDRSELVGEVRFSEVLNRVTGDIGVEISRLGIDPVVQVLLEMKSYS